MKRLLMALVLLFPETSEAQGLRKLGGADETDRVRIAEYAESDRQEKWMWLVGLIAAAGIGYVIWKEYDKKQRGDKS